MLKEILAVSGKPGLYKLVSRAKNMLIIESLTDQKRIPAYSRDKVISVADVSVYTTDGDLLVGEILTKIKEKENGGSVSVDLNKATPDEIRAYFAEIVPTFDREKVYPTDIKKLLKWYEILIANGITDFSTKEDTEETKTEEAGTDAPTKEEEKASKSATVAKAKPTAAKRKDASLTSVRTAKPAKAKSTNAAATKKSVVGAKRGG